MKVTKYLFFIATALLFLTCGDDDQLTYNNADGKFVRFHLQVNSNNEVIEAPGINNSAIAVASYTKDNFSELKIPVALTASLQENVTVTFATELTNLQNVDISPANTIEFTPNKLVDTIRVKFNERWDLTQNPQIKFSLTEVSDSSINLGMPNSVLPNNELTINFTQVDVTYNFNPPTIVDNIVGNIGEQVTIDVNFPQGYFESELNTVELFQEESSNFNYTLTRLPFTDPNKVSYTFTVDENIAVDVLEFSTVFKMNNLTGYDLVGTDEFTIKKPIVIDRDNSVNTANDFYDLSNPFHRTYGENWLDANANGTCAWSRWFAFSYPVVVDASHPNAVLFDDMGTPDPSDDVYHHAFRIGFDSPNAGRTTNSFNLKRWFTNESTDADVSPGFNVNPALEFFPANGNSITNGFVQVIEQDITITGRSGNSYVIRIFGSGTYQKINNDLYEIDLTLNARNTVLFSGTVSSKYKIYNNNSYQRPSLISDSCIQPREL